MTSYADKKYELIITIDDNDAYILRRPTSVITEEKWVVVEATLEKLIYVRNEILKGGAGLSAPQIGLNYPIFIYTPDRTIKKIKVVVNPCFEPLNNEQIIAYEACYSLPLQCTKLKRYKKIKVSYQTLTGEYVEDIIEGFSAKVFQHEIDHLEGRLTIDHNSAEVITFTESQSFQSFMKQVYFDDSQTHIK